MLKRILVASLLCLALLAASLVGCAAPAVEEEVEEVEEVEEEPSGE